MNRQARKLHNERNKSCYNHERYTHNVFQLTRLPPWYEHIGLLLHAIGNSLCISLHHVHSKGCIKNSYLEELSIYVCTVYILCVCSSQWTMCSFCVQFLKCNICIHVLEYELGFIYKLLPFLLEMSQQLDYFSQFFAQTSYK